jgi:hypothetical protein
MLLKCKSTCVFGHCMFVVAWTPYFVCIESMGLRPISPRASLGVKVDTHACATAKSDEKGSVLDMGQDTCVSYLGI